MRSNENGLEKLIRGRRTSKRGRASLDRIEDIFEADDEAEELEDEAYRDHGVNFRDSKDPMDLFLRGRI